MTLSRWITGLVTMAPLMVAAQDNEARRAETTERAVLIGASYAEGWASPSLPGLEIVNRGRSGEETREMLARFEADVVLARPDTVIIWGHINDIFRAPNGDMSAAAKQAMLNLEEMVHSAQRANIRAIIATEITLAEPRGFMNWAASIVGGLMGKVSYQTRVSNHVREVNVFLRDLASRNGLTLLDLERALSDADGQRRSEFTRDDGSHINAAGYDALTAFAANQLGDH
jgi:lysophospholipase L1-like esterase